jgi:dTDP-4-dehydrorhamnose 3,5-epimerase-like enzyme
MNTLNNVKRLSLDLFDNKNGFIVPIEFSTLPFFPQRLYYISGAVKPRGGHAHRTIEQILICVHGCVRNTTYDGKSDMVTTLNEPNDGLYIPAGLWDEQEYETQDSVLLVLANKTYDSKDYIHDWKEFLNFRKEE